MAGTRIHKKFLVSGTSGSETITLIKSLEEMKAIMKIVESLDDSIMLIKGVIETIENKTKNREIGSLVCY